MRLRVPAVLANVRGMKGLAFAASLALVLAVPLAAQSLPQPEQVRAPQPAWAFEASDLEPEDGYIFGVLANGMRYIIRANGTPAGTALVRMEIDAGRLDEGDSERGAAHFVEHMAFSGSTNVPEGEMVKLLERLGLKFGADTNAETSFGYTQYKLDLPNTSPELLDTALFLMRETASELQFDPQAVERERGILLAEQRDRTNFAFLNIYDLVEFAAPGSRLAARFPGAGREDLELVDAATLRNFWSRNYVPSKATLVIVGDFDAAEVEARVRERFASWQPLGSVPQPSAGPVDPGRAGLTDIHLDPSLSEQLTISRSTPWHAVPDSMAEREAQIIKAIGYGILSRRFQRAAQSAEPPFRSAAFGTSEVLEAWRETSLTIGAIEGRWADGLAAATALYRQFLAYGVDEREIAEQMAGLRTGFENAVASRSTRSHGSFASRALALTRDGKVPTSPESSLALLETMVPGITPEAVLAAIRTDVIPLDNPLIRFSGRSAPMGGEEALRSAWDMANSAPVSAPDQTGPAIWNYVDFGPAGQVVSDTTSPVLDIRQLVFANGVRLNLKPTGLAQDRISLSLGIDGGSYLDTREEPLRTDLTGLFAAGGLGRLSQDELQSVLAGRSVNFSLSDGPDRFAFATTTTRRDLELQLQLVAAYLTDPGYRPEPLTRFRNGIDDYYARLTSTPAAALAAESGSFLSDDDPRFGVPDRLAYKALDFDGLRDAIGDRLRNGAIELALVGDFEQEEAIALVSRTLGALPAREAEFGRYPASRQRSFTARRGEHIVFHDGEPDQALLSLVWPTRDYSDAMSVVEFNLLEAIVMLEVTEALREELGKAYAPGVSSSQSANFDGYGTFTISAAIERGEVAATRGVLTQLIARLRSNPVSADTLERARRPILQGLDNALKTNGGWMAQVARAQSEPQRIERFLKARERYESVTAERLRDLAAQYLTADGAVEFIVLPRPVTPDESEEETEE